MWKALLSRAPLPTSVAVYSASSLPASKRKQHQRHGSTATASFFSKGKLGELAAAVPPGFQCAVGEVEYLLPEGAGPRPSSSSSSSASTSSKGARKPVSLVVGLGKQSGERGAAVPSIRDYRLAVTNAVRKAKKMEVSALTLHPPAFDDVSTVADVFHPARLLPKNEVVEKTATFAVTAAYEYNRLKSKSKGTANEAHKGKGKAKRKARSSATAATASPPLDIVIASSQSEAIQTGAVIGSCINDCRNLGNLREDEGVPALYVEWATRFVVPEGVKVRKVLKGAEIDRAGLRLLHSVGKGSIHPPYVLVLEYVGNKKVSTSTALVGKGVTFDCGGLNIKPYGSMESMHTDMMGAATVLSTLKAVATLKLPVNVVGAVGLVENAIGPSSYFPSSILTSLKGLTVEVLNTDAEGRLVLADVLTYVQQHARLEKTPSTIIDLATLTGAIMVSLGSRRAGLFSNSSRLSEKLMATGTQSGEELWPMPIGPEHTNMMKGGMADLVNSAAGRQAGACTAAAFLANFVEPGKEWAHLDIAGTADTGDKPKGFHPAGVTGFGVQLLMDYLRRR